MGIAYVSNERKMSAFAAAALLLSSLSLGGCATSTPGSSLMDARAEQPGQPPKTTGYPAVEDVPPPPEKPAMTADEQSKLKKELSAARDRQSPDGKAKAGAVRAQAKKPTTPSQ